MFGEEVIILRYVFIVEVGDTEIEDDGKQKGEVEDGEINTIRCCAHLKLNCFIYSENIDRFYKQI